MDIYIIQRYTFIYISFVSVLGYPAQENRQSEKGVFSSNDFLSALSRCPHALIWRLLRTEGVRSAPKASVQHWAANMSSEQRWKNIQACEQCLCKFFPRFGKIGAKLYAVLL